MLLVSKKTLLAEVEKAMILVNPRSKVQREQCLLFGISSSDFFLMSCDDSSEYMKKMTNGRATEFLHHATVNAKDLKDLIKKLPNDEVTISFAKETIANKKGVQKEGYQITFLSGNASLKIQGLPPEEYPFNADLDVARIDYPSIGVDNATLQKALSQVSFAMCQDSQKTHLQFLKSVYFESFGNGAYGLVATDTFVCAIVDCLNLMDCDQSFLINEKVINLLKKSVVKSVNFLDEVVVFVCDNAQITTKRIAKKFPDYQSIVPKDQDRKISIPKAILESALKRYQDQETISCAFSKEGFSISAQNNVTSEKGDYLKEGADFSINLDPVLFLACVKNIQGKTIVIQAGPTQENPLLISDDTQDENMSLICILIGQVTE